MSDFILPDIGEGIVECELVQWLISEGDMIEEDQPVVEVMTDKALVEITAPESGQVTKLYCEQGQIAKVHAPLFGYEPRDQEGSGQDSPAEDSAEQDQSQQAEPEQKTGAPAKATPTSEAKASDSEPVSAAKTSAGSNRQRVPASPAVRRLVREHEIELATINGTGKDGRVLKADVLAHLDNPEAAAAPSADMAEADRKPATEQQARVESIKGMRAVMAKRMAVAASTIPHFTYSEDIDMTDLLALRERLKPEVEALGSRITLMPFIMKAMALAVRDFPILNSRINDEVTEIHYQPHCNIGMAVDSKAGLIVPNVKGVESLTLLEIAAEVARLTQAARDGRVRQEDLQGGTISISNIGALGGVHAAPIINAPEVAIVALGRTQRLPRFDVNGQVVERAIMTASWAGDHRIIDGGTIARFCNCWKGYLESPESMLLHLG
ncbi:MAG: 2-oxo acid dehydrogenase subunit E2 [Marinobacter sp.]|uniref:2-oxo acid dehydrogenase subunit E2 n=1 Tax=Marinobacter sp. TaxID=50741 RepID=UPI00349FE315